MRVLLLSIINYKLLVGHLHNAYYYVNCNECNMKLKMIKIIVTKKNLVCIEKIWINNKFDHY